MKKLLSAVTSVAMSFSLMAGAFASPVSAAGSDTASQPKLNMGGVLDVSANKNAGESVEWNMGTAIAAPGMSVTVPVVVMLPLLEELIVPATTSTYIFLQAVFTEEASLLA